MKHKLTLVLLLWSCLGVAQENSFTSSEIRINQIIEGTLLMPQNEENPELVIFIQGSGPTDRNGNQAFMKNDSFKKLAQGLAEKGIASFRYDKRIMAMDRLGITEEQIRFDDFVSDASDVLDFFTQRQSPAFRKLVVLGHSQGSLVGMLAAREKADAFISISGAGQPIDSVIVNQIEQQIPGLEKSARSAFKEMREEGETSDFNPALASIFRPQLQAFMLSWMKYDPVREIAQLQMPVLIVNGTKDLQVSQKEADLLQNAYPDAKRVDLEGMNHIFRKIEGGDLENQKSYNEAQRPLHPDLLPTLETFVKSL